MWRGRSFLALKTGGNLGVRRSRRWMSTDAGRRVVALWGNGDYGRLGLGSLESQWRPAICSAFDRDNIRAVACGGAHTLFLTETGRVYATGLNNFGQLGISVDKRFSLEPVEVPGLQKEILQISAGYNHSCAITVDGELYMWGCNSSGQLGLGKKAARAIPVSTRVESLTGINIKMTALGSDHSVAVTDKGEVLSWGEGGSGRLGHGHKPTFFGFLKSSSEFIPRLVKELEGIKVKSVAAGLLHSAFIDANGVLYTLGERATDKGFGDANGKMLSMIRELPYSQEVACGGYHTCIVTSSGDLFSWGTNENGCLGNGSTDVLHLPEKVDVCLLKSSVTKISCGWKHTAAISSKVRLELGFPHFCFLAGALSSLKLHERGIDGRIFTWGWGGSHGTFSVDGHSSGGQLGHGDDVDYMKPMMVNLEDNANALQISCGFNHTAAILEYS